MSLVLDYTDPYIWQYTSVPRVRAGVCEVCHGAPRTGYTVCYSCDQTMGQVSRPLSVVVPISLYEHGSQYHRVLRYYKDGEPGAAQDRFKLQVAATLVRFVVRHGHCVTGADGPAWDTITTVPSSRERAGEHPLVEAVKRIRPFKDLYQPLLRPGRVAVTWNHASDNGYEVTQEVRGLKVLLIEDTFTSGAHLQSAASTLQRAGARVLAAVVLGRIINTSYSDETRTLWDAAKKVPFSFDVCCICRAA